MPLNLSGLSKELLCIEYPGVVQSVSNMLESLGGEKEISRVISSHNRRLELRFRPDDVYCKPVCGDRCKTNSILLRVKFRKKKGKNEFLNLRSTSIEVVARVKTVFKFKSLCDFQFLPMDVKPNGDVVNLSPEFLPEDVSGDKLHEWLETPIEYFLPPPVFARVDNLATNSYMYRKGVASNESTSVIGRTRKRRSGYAVFVSFNIKSIPAKPRERALKLVQLKLCEQHFETIKKLFERRPLWSKLAVMCETKLSHDILKIVLPAVAYYFVTGPFRVMWVKFGYDPRLDPEAKIYQTLDYRMRSLAGLSSLIKAKRAYTNYVLPNKSTHPTKKAVVISKTSLETSETNDSVSTLRGDEYMFTTTSVPASRQMFYQYIDLKVPEIESMFARLPKTSAKEVCDPKTGWLPRGFEQHCREVITSYLKVNLKREKPTENTEELKPDEEPDDSSDEEAVWQEDIPDEEIDLSDIDQEQE